MFIETTDGKLLNSKYVVYFEVNKCINRDAASLNALTSGNRMITVYSNNIEKTEAALQDLQEGIAKGATLISYKGN
jgi:hypothetical protein